MMPSLLRQKSQEEFRVGCLESAISSHRAEIAKLYKAIDKARANGVYRRRPLADYRKELHRRRRGLTRAAFERQAWAGTASETTWRRLRWIWAVERLRHEIEKRWGDARRRDELVLEYESAIAEQRFKPKTLRAYARYLESDRRYRDQALRELQALSEVLVRPYHSWRQPRHSWRQQPDPEDLFVDGAEGWLRRQLEGLANESTS